MILYQITILAGEDIYYAINIDKNMLLKDIKERNLRETKHPGIPRILSQMSKLAENSLKLALLSPEPAKEGYAIGHCIYNYAHTNSLVSPIFVLNSRPEVIDCLSNGCTDTYFVHEPRPQTLTGHSFSGLWTWTSLRDSFLARKPEGDPIETQNQTPYDIEFSEEIITNQSNQNQNQT